ncbi:hypothetical protein WJX72_012189 [[Myrmecia] bisecta]|uniref:Cytochrome c oxidase subunit n=1 Tax=[Myrmecia] bisecta TaxID=41462 RepID=A0AAW1PE33_9CHLO
MGNTVSHCEGAPEAVQTPEEEQAEQVEILTEEETVEEQEPEEEEAEAVVEVKSAPYDVRFPSTNQARHCYTRYNEFYKCKGLKDESDPECEFYQKAYRSICPNEWVERWNEQREAGTWPGKY